LGKQAKEDQAGKEKGNPKKQVALDLIVRNA
jgi:hypothetical protein